MDTKDWYSWIDLMPPKPDDFHVVGEVFLSNAGVKANICMREPQGFNPNILLLDLHLVQESGMWPQVMTWKQIRYDKILLPEGTRYEKVEMFLDGALLVTMDVDEVR